MSFSDFAIYADESGSPVLTADKDDFPIFVLVFLVVRKNIYRDSLVPAVQKLKFDFVGHDQIVLHERDIRRQDGPFLFLRASADERRAFLERVNEVMEAAEVTLVTAIIDKQALGTRYADPWSPYELALTFCMEKAAKVLRDAGETDKGVHVVFESRGAKEDKELELAFRRVAGGDPLIGNPSRPVMRLRWTPLFSDKRCNSTGLQVADLAARPLGLRYMRPEQSNRAADILGRKVAFPSPKVFPR